MTMTSMVSLHLAYAVLNGYVWVKNQICAIQMNKEVSK